MVKYDILVSIPFYSSSIAGSSVNGINPSIWSESVVHFVVAFIFAGLGAASY